jgi:hypothetical protein
MAESKLPTKEELIAAKENARAEPLTVALPRFTWGFILDSAKAGATRERNGPNTESRKKGEDSFEEARKAIEEVLDL